MEELDEYGRFNTRYEGAGQLTYMPGYLDGKFVPVESVPVYFEVRQLFDGRLLVACVSLKGPIAEHAHALDGRLLSGEPFSTMWGRRIKEIYRNDGPVWKVHYAANMTRVRYTKASQPDDHSIQFALHNFIPGRNSDKSGDRIEIQLPDHKLTITRAGNYGVQVDNLRRQGGNLRTCWAALEQTGSEEGCVGLRSAHDMVDSMLIPISLAAGTLVTAPQMITFDGSGNRNDVEHYSSPASGFSDFIPANGWDSPVKDTVERWFSASRPQLLSSDEVAVAIHQHLDACSSEVYLETRALVAATLLDVLAGRYAAKWTDKEPHKIVFRTKLVRLLDDVGMNMTPGRVAAVIKARNSLVHAGRFVAAEGNETYREFCNLLLLGRSILLRLVGVPSTLHEQITA